MNTENIHQSGKPDRNASCWCLFAVACIVFLYIAFNNYTRFLHEHLLILPCLLFLGTRLEHRDGNRHNRLPLLSVMMLVWYIILNIKRSIDSTEDVNITQFLSTYLFALPLASLLQDGDKKKALKLFAGAYLAASGVLTASGLLLILDCVPGFLTEQIYWDGARLHTFWHPNIAACFLMIGIAFCTAFFSQAKSRWSKLGLCLLTILMLGAIALTNCRTIIILTGGYLGTTVFFMATKHGKKWFLPGVLAVLVVTVGFYVCTNQLYQANNDALITKYTQQYSEQIASEKAEATASDADNKATANSEKNTSKKAETTVSDADNKATTNSEKNTSKKIETTESDADNKVTTNSEKSTSKKTEKAASDADEKATGDQEETLPIKVNSKTGKVSLKTDNPQGSLKRDFGTLNSRTRIWGSALYAIRETPDILRWGMFDPGWYVSFYTTSPVSHLHNSWLECLVALGLVGFMIAALLTLQAVWNCLVILWKHHDDVWKRTVALLTLCLMVAAFLEPYLFYTGISYHPVDFLFFLCAGYLAHWQETYNQGILTAIRSRIPFLKK